MTKDELVMGVDNLATAVDLVNKTCNLSAEVEEFMQTEDAFDRDHEFAPADKRERFLIQQATAQRKARIQRVADATVLEDAVTPVLKAAIAAEEEPPSEVDTLTRGGNLSTEGLLLAKLLEESRTNRVVDDLKTMDIHGVAALYSAALETGDVTTVKVIEREVRQGLPRTMRARGNTTEDVKALVELRSKVRQIRQGRVSADLRGLEDRLAAAARRLSLLRPIWGSGLGSRPVDLDLLRREIKRKREQAALADG
jgi:hypothetical protein